MKKHRKEGFTGEKLVVIPPNIRRQIDTDSICSKLFLSDIGLFPKASNHCVERPQGCTEYVIQFCFEGEGYAIYNGQKEAISRNQYFILPPDKPHTYGSMEGSEWKVGWIHFSGEAAENFIQRINNKGFGKAHNMKCSSTWLRDFVDIIDSLMLDLSFANVAYSGCRLWSALGAFIFSERLENDSERSTAVQKALAFIQENISSQLAVDDIAAAAGLSNSRLSVLFKQKTGSSPKEYHIGLKVQKACSLLSLSDWSIKDIARELGFYDPYYFSRCFSQRMGLSPNNYRKKNVY